jgi:peptidoglycan/xylan/chitin deacetylase (PgdA/CDA1 family)
MGRGASRALALVALLGVAAAVAVIVLGQGGGGSGGPGGGAASGAATGASCGSRGTRPTVAAGTLVRNARPQPDWGPYAGPVPILRYDVVGEASPREAYAELFVPPGDFGDQMDWLAEHGYEAVTLGAVQRAWFAGGTLPSKPVVLTFDGVRGDLVGTVEPELTRRGWPGVLVLDPKGASAKANAVAGLVAIGWELEAGGPDPAVSRRSLAAHFAAPVRNFAFPQGGFDEAKVPALKAAGYRGATVPGYGFAESSDPFDLPQITVFGLSKVQGFAEALRSRGGGVGA